MTNGNWPAPKRDDSGSQSILNPFVESTGFDCPRGSWSKALHG
jgi:hypothetical protein